MKYRLLSLFVALICVTTSFAQTFKLSGDLREMLAERAVPKRSVAASPSRITLLMKVTDASEMAGVCADYGMKMVTDLGYIAVVTVPKDQIEKAAADPRVVRMEQEGRYELKLDDAHSIIKKTSQSLKDPDGIDYPVNQQGSGMINAYAGLCEILGLPTGIEADTVNCQLSTLMIGTTSLVASSARSRQRRAYI